MKLNKKKISLLTILMIISIYITAAAPLGDITDLKNTSYAPDYIKWTWKDPTDANFSKVMIYINGDFKTNVSKGKQSYNATGLDADTEYEIETRTVDKRGNISQNWKNNSVKTAAIDIDNIPPDSITDLKNTSYATDYIKWTWKDPTDKDFANVMIYINGDFKTNVSKGKKSYNATGLENDTEYEIGTRTVDSSGNINQTWKNSTIKTAPKNNTNDTEPPNSITDLKNTSYATDYIRWAWKDPTDDDFANVMVYIDGDFKTNVSKGRQSYNVTGLEAGKEYEIETRTVDSSGNINKTWINNSAKTSGIGPKITIINEPNNLNVSIGESLYFNIKVDQGANVTWSIGNSAVKSEDILVNKNSSYTFKPSSKGTHNVRVVAKNDNGTSIKNWPVIARSKTYSTGNRIWDGSRPDEYSLKYTWNPMSFSGFYYNVDNDVGNENIAISLDSYTDRNINEGDITYSTAPEEVNFEYSDFGKYQVIGFMADKYFAGYTDNTKPPKPKEEVKKISVIAQGQLHKVLMDDDEKRTLGLGATITLKEGYVLQAKDVGDRTMFITLLKDGKVVDPAAFLNAGETYVYKKKVGTVNELPIIMVRFETVFMGKESQMAILKGLFQISENYIEVDNGDRHGVMEITEASDNKIVMESHNSVSLSEGSTIDLMGNLKIIVADNSSVVRFALFSENTGTYNVRGTIYPATTRWTPMNFGLNVGKTNIGFYYDIDEDIGTEELTIEEIKGRSIPEGKLIYSTSPQEVSFNYQGFGSYSVIGFMADKYFAGYTSGSVPSNNKKIGTIGNGQLHKILFDDDEKRVISVGGTLTLKEGYVLKAKEIDVGAGSGQMWMTLLKNGNEIDNDVVMTGDNYVYMKKVGGVSDLPIIVVRIDSVFRGREINAAFIKGVFQISDSYTKVGVGDNYKLMEVVTTGDKIVMENKNSIGLSEGSTIDLMGNVKFKAADSGSVRFYPFVTVTSDMVANKLKIDAPSKATAGDTISIKVTANNESIEGVSISIDGVDAIENNTNVNGTIGYVLPKTLKGAHNITATKLGYEKSVSSIEISQYIENKLSINIPAVANQFETIVINVAHNDTPVSGVDVAFDNNSIGTTDNSGKLSYTLDKSGTHIVTVSKSGYISASREIEVKVLFSEFKALDINVTPDAIYTGEDIIVRSSITNVGTKGDSIPVTLIINDTEIDSRNVTLAPMEKKEINFTHKIGLEKGNYTVQILGQKGTLEVKEKPFNVALATGILTLIGAIVIFLLTRKKGLSTLSEELRTVLRRR